MDQCKPLTGGGGGGGGGGADEDDFSPALTPDGIGGFGAVMDMLRQAAGEAAPGMTYEDMLEMGERLGTVNNGATVIACSLKVLLRAGSAWFSA